MSSSYNAKQKCPKCLTENCYIGLNVVECWNVDCKFYSEKQHKILLERKKRNGQAPEINELYNHNNFYKPKVVTEKDLDTQKSIAQLIKDYLDSSP